MLWKLSVTSMVAVALALPIASAASTARTQPLAAAEPGSRIEAVATETSRTPYQAYIYPPDCVGGSNICKLATEVVPARSRLEIHRLACLGNHSGDLVPIVTGNADVETAAGAFVQRVDLLEGRVTRNPPSTLSVWSVIGQTLMFVPARHRLRITISTGSPVNSSSGCVVSSYLVKLKG